MQVRLLRKSDLRPTRMSGVVGQKWRTSGYHFDLLATLKAFAVLFYLVHYVLQRVRAVDRKADQQQIRLWI